MADGDATVGIPEMDARRHAEAEPFVLDRAENPHPRMLSEALYFRSIAFDSAETFAFWMGYLVAMCGATGCSVQELDAWLDSHVEAVEPKPSPLADLFPGVPVEVRGR